MQWIRNTVLTGLTGMCCISLYADDPGQQAYKDGQYVQALTYYTSVLNEEGPQADIYFNMANCLLKKGEPGRAIAYYKRALRLAPRDQDIRANLKLAIKHAGISDPDQLGLFADFCLYWHHGLNITESWLAAVTLYIISVFLMCLWFAGKKKLLVRVVIVLIFLAVLFLSSVIVKYTDMQNPDRGVVVAEKAAVFSGKGTDYSRILQIKEGTILRVLDQEENWCKILAGKKKKGWISAKDIILY